MFTRCQQHIEVCHSKQRLKRRPMITGSQYRCAVPWATERTNSQKPSKVRKKQNKFSGLFITISENLGGWGDSSTPLSVNLISSARSTITYQSAKEFFFLTRNCSSPFLRPHATEILCQSHNYARNASILRIGRTVYFNSGIYIV